MIVALTSASLDITLGVAWWTIKQVFSGAVYLGTYLFSESSSSKKNKILGDDPNFVPYAFSIVELEITHSHTTINNGEAHKTETQACNEFVEISKNESILTTNEKYFKIPLSEIVKRKDKLPIWIVPFLNTYPLTNYAIVCTAKNAFVARAVQSPIFSPFTLSKHINVSSKQLENLFVYLRHDDIEITIKALQTGLV
jgi:hypothetical protein